MKEERLWEHYDRSVDEYRFQVNLNWSRSQYLFVLNVAILVAGIGLLSASNVPDGVPIIVFTVGTARALFAILASYTQHGYYKNARDLKERLEAELGLGDLAIKTTTGMGGRRKRLASLNTFQRLMLGLLILADGTGVIASVQRAGRTETQTNVELVVALRVPSDGSSEGRAIPVVLSQAGEVVASATWRTGGVLAVSVAPGRYQLAAAARTICRRRVHVTSTPLQRVSMHCR